MTTDTTSVDTNNRQDQTTEERFFDLLHTFPLEFEHLLMRAQTEEHSFDFTTNGRMMQFRSKFYTYLRLIRAHSSLRPDLFAAAKVVRLSAGTGLTKNVLTIGPLMDGWEAQVIREKLGLTKGQPTPAEVAQDDLRLGFAADGRKRFDTARVELRKLREQEQGLNTSEEGFKEPFGRSNP